jgi:7-carboxy-7-deazaguanine synthase
MTIPAILRAIRTHRTRHACLTGGEPLLQPASIDLLEALARQGLQTIVETGGSLDVAPYVGLANVVLSVDVKCPASGMSARNRWSNLPLLRPTDAVKFVIQDRADYRYAKHVLQERPYLAQTVFQPVWGTDAGRLADWVLADHLDVRVMLQEHKHLWGDVPGR